MLSGPRAAGSLAHLRKRLIDGEARRLLPGRKLLEHLRERYDDCPRRQPHRSDRWAGMFSSLAEPCKSHCSPPPLPTPPPRLQGREGRASSGTAGSGVGALLHLAEHIVEVEAGGLLALRILPERLQVLPDKGLRRHQQVDVVDKP